MQLLESAPAVLVSRQLAHKLINRIQAMKLVLQLTPVEEARLRINKTDWALKELDELSRLVITHVESPEEEKERRAREAAE